MNKPQNQDQSIFELESFLKNLPSLPGVYQMYDKNNVIIYIGKAKNLKNRVNNYFQKKAQDTKTIQLVSHICYIDILISTSDYDAYILESTLIKKYKPRYNIIFKDDKSYPYLVLSQHKYPRVFSYRANRKEQGEHFGPYVSMSSTKNTLALLQKIFPIRQCRDAYYNNRSRPCLQYQIKRCLAPCVGKISVEDYQGQVDILRQFLQGKLLDVLGHVANKMELVSQDENYELAANYRDQLIMLRKLQEQQIVDINTDKDSDIFAIAQDGLDFIIVILQVKAGKISGDRHWFIKDNSANSIKVFEAFLSHYYLSEHQRNIWPEEIILPQNLAVETQLLKSISIYANKSINWIYFPKEIKLKWQNLALTNAKQKLKIKIASKSDYRKRLIELQNLLDLDKLPTQIECFDISHFQGEATIASCVVFDIHGIKKNAYRKFNISGINPGDDYAAIKQALMRRLIKAKEGNTIPDVLIIDGGKGQFKQAYDVLVELDLLKQIALVSLGKGPKRISGDEDIFTLLQKEPLRLDEHNPAFLLLRHIRDESHRFAILGQRAKVAKNRKKSVIDEIPGIGSKRKKALLNHFGGWQELAKASVLEIQKIPSISKNLAEKIWYSFK